MQTPILLIKPKLYIIRSQLSLNLLSEDILVVSLFMMIVGLSLQMDAFKEEMERDCN